MDVPNVSSMFECCAHKVGNMKVVSDVKRRLDYKGHNFMGPRWVHHNCVTSFWFEKCFLRQSDLVKSHI